jgi:hypothetical protein
LKIIDFPEVHSYLNPNTKDYFLALSRVEDFALFENPVVRTTIDQKWPVVQKYTIIFLLVPFTIYLGLFITLSNAFGGQIDEDTPETRLA